MATVEDFDKYKEWLDTYGYDDDADVTWEYFRDNYVWCDRCKSYQEGQCICYAR